MIVECKQCGAPLDVERGSAFARCSYCGHTNKVKSAKTLMAESPAAWQPPPVWQPPPQFKAPQAPLPYRPRPAPRKANTAGPIMAGLVILGATGAALWASGVVTTLPFVGLVTDGPPLVATLELGAQPSPAPVSGVANGSYEASSLGVGCRGYLTRQPHVVLRTSSPTAVRLDVDRVDVDLVMAVRTADGQWVCDDDSGGNRMPRVVTTLPAGEHRVWVGTYSTSDSSAFVLRVDAQAVTGAAGPIVSGVAPDAAPSIGTLAVGLERADGSWSGTTTGWVDASQLASSCRGWIPVAPHLAITTAEPRELELVTRENQSTDLVMVVRSPSGVLYCDDDSGGSLNPRIQTTLEVGTTAVWVGVFHAEGQGSFLLDVRELGDARSSRAQPASRPTLGTVNLDVPERPSSFRGTTRPEQSIREVGSRCPGFVGRSHDLVVATTVPRSLTLRARGGTGLRLVSRSPEGQVRCVEASGSQDVVMTETFTSGVHHVWVGTARRRPSGYQLLLE